MMICRQANAEVASCFFAVYLWTACLNLDGGAAEIFHFEDFPLPANKSLQFIRMFYVYAKDESRGDNSAEAFVSFEGIRPYSSVSAHSDKSLKEYRGLQLGLVKHDKLWGLINPDRFCCTYDDIAQNLCRNKDQLMVTKTPGFSDDDLGIYMHDVYFPDNDLYTPKERKVNIKETGVYILWLSNCGNIHGAVLSGNLIVKNSYGFLPGNEYHKISFYRWLGIVYIVLATGWLYLTIRWRSELVKLHSCIACVILLALVESVLSYMFVTEWNSSGEHSRPLFLVSALAASSKSAFLYMIVILVSLGWGVLRHSVESTKYCKVFIVCVLYMAFSVAYEVVNSYELMFGSQLSCLLPAGLLSGIIFYWIATSLTTYIGMFRERDQLERLAMFQWLWRVLVFVVGIALVSHIWRIYSISGDRTHWRFEWLLTDGVSHVLLCLVLAVLMLLWGPHKQCLSMCLNEVDLVGSNQKIEVEKIGASSVSVEDNAFLLQNAEPVGTTDA